MDVSPNRCSTSTEQNRGMSPPLNRLRTRELSTKAMTRHLPTIVCSLGDWSKAAFGLFSCTIGGWDHHGSSPGESIDETLPIKCRQIDRAVAGLITDLKQRGLLDETLVIWGGEFGRTPMMQNNVRKKLVKGFIGRGPPPPRLYHVDGRRRNQTGSLWANRRYWLLHYRKCGQCTRSAIHHSPPDWNRSQTVPFPLSRPQTEAHRPIRRRQSDSRYPCLIGSNKTHSRFK